MPYDSIVCVKQVPDTANVTADAMKEDGTVNRSALPAVFNPDDLHALETALQIRDEHGGSWRGAAGAADAAHRDSRRRGSRAAGR